MNDFESPRTVIQSSDFREIAAYYDYGYDQDMDDALDASQWVLFANETPQGVPNDLQTPSERINRKKSRSFCRRNGVAYSGLLKSAVLATIDSQDDADNNECCFPSRHESIGFCSVSSAEERPVTPRKRARRFSPACSEVVDDNGDDLILQACDLFGTVMGFSLDEESAEIAVARRVSRRTSHESPRAESKDNQP